MTAEQNMCTLAAELDTAEISAMTAEDQNRWGADAKRLGEAASVLPDEELAGLGQDLLDVVGDGEAVNAAKLGIQVKFLALACEERGYA